MRAPRFDGCCHCGERLIASPVSELLPERVSSELRHLQAQLAAQTLSCKNRDYQRATGRVYRASFSTGGYRRLPPTFLPVSI